MHIAIDGRTIVQSRTGVGVYAQRLVRSLLQIDPDNEYTLFLVEDDASLAGANLKKVMITGYTRIGPNRFWENFLLPPYLKKHKVDVYFSPAYVLPILRRSRNRSSPADGTKFVVTIHDLVAFIYPKTFTLKMRLWQRLFVGNAVRVADRILADSEATKRDILKFFDLPPESITVVHLPVGEQFHRIHDPDVLADIRRRHHLPDEFILYVGTLEPRKNVARLAKAYSLLSNEIRDRYSLVLAGAAGWFSTDIIREIEALRMGDRIRMIGYVDQQTLPGLYSLASLFAYISVYEGFGAPPLEAMACGTPVISSNSSSLPEAVGDAGVLVDPYNVDEIAAHLQRLLTDDSLRIGLSNAGLERVKRFDGATKAREVLGIFEEVLAGKVPTSRRPS
jgi:glycosyltransferase involved in cell wall biosynthesis